MLRLILLEGKLIPEGDKDAAILEKAEDGSHWDAEEVKPISNRYLRKWHKLLRFGFDYWEAMPVTVGGQTWVPTKDFDEFKGKIKMLAGFKHIVGYPDGTWTFRPWSSHEIINAGRFDELYSATIDIFLDLLFEEDSEEWRKIENEILDFG